MAQCTSCGTENVDGVRFCVQCGASLTPAPAPEGWRGGVGNAPTGEANRPAGSYTPPSSPLSYTPPPLPYQQSSAEQMHPAVPAIVSLLFPGLGLLFVPNKAGLGIGIFAGVLVYGLISFVLAFVFIGFCMLMIMPLFNVVAAVHSYDEAAKASNGKFQPVLFKS